MPFTSNHEWDMPEPGGDTDIWGDKLNDMFELMDDQIILDGPFSERPAPGDTELVYYHATDESIIYYNMGTSWKAISGVTDDTFSYVSGHTAWEHGLSDEEIHRFSVVTGDTFNVSSLELREKGGGTEDTACYMDVYDASDSTQLASVNLNSRVDVNVGSIDGATILFRFTNQTGDTVDSSITVRGYVE